MVNDPPGFGASVVVDAAVALDVVLALSLLVVSSEPQAAAIASNNPHAST
jgi:hypothetical protein